MKRSTKAALLAVAVSLVWGGAPLSAQGTAEKPAATWKPFQEFGFLPGSWSGTAESGTRVGGRVSRFSMEMNGNYLLQRGTTVFPAQGTTPEESTEEIGYVSYDRDRRKYVASFFFSTGVSGTYDVDFPSDGVIRLTSTALLNFESGGRTRLTFSKKSDSEIAYQLEIAPAGKDFVSFVTCRMTKR